MKTRAVVTAALLLTLTGCYTWRPAPSPLGQFIADNEPDSVRIWLNGEPQARLIIGPQIEGDTLVGLSPGGGDLRQADTDQPRDTDYVEPVRVLLVDVAYAEFQDHGKGGEASTGLAMVAGLAAGLVFLLVTQSLTFPPPP